MWYSPHDFGNSRSPWSSPGVWTLVGVIKLIWLFPYMLLRKCVHPKFKYPTPFTFLILVLGIVIQYIQETFLDKVYF